MNWTFKEEVTKILKSGRTRKHALIECGCGNTRFVTFSEWTRMQTDSHNSNISLNGCRKCSFEDRNKKTEKQKAYKMLYNNLKSSCKRRSLKLDLTLQEATDIYKSNCYYCNSTPSNEYNSKNLGTGIVKYSGIDRINSNEGYTKSNVVACCFNCNRAKSNLDQKEFYQLIENIYKFRVQRLSRRGE